MIEQVWARLRLIVSKAQPTRIGEDKIQARVLDRETPPNIERVEPYGFSYRPHPGGQAYLLFPSGNRSYGMAIVIGDKQYQMQLEEGEVAIHDDEGNYVLLKRGGIIEAKASTKVLADTPLFETTGDAKIGGDLLVEGQTTSVGGYYGAGGGVARMYGGAYVDGEFKVNGKDVSDLHRHPETGSITGGVV